MRDSLVFGVKAKQLIVLVNQEFGKINVLLTGGDAEFLANHLKTKIFVNPNLVLYGLNKILTYNVQTQE